MSGVIQALEQEVKAIEESIQKHKTTHPEIITELMSMRAKVEHIIVLLKEGEDLHMMCTGCGLVLPACEYDFSTVVQNCNDCGNHIQIEVTCPKCNKTRVVYRDRNFEGD